MAGFSNKWLLAFVLPFSFYMSGKEGLEKPGSTVPMHPFHLSVTEINHNKEEASLEISCKLFTDDFEKVLGKNYKAKVDLINPADRKAADNWVSDYITRHLSIRVDDKSVVPNYLGFEKDGDATYVYLEVPKVPTVKTLSIANKILHDLFDDQTNLVHAIVNGERKTMKAEYPKADMAFSF